MSRYTSNCSFLLALVIAITSCGEVEELLPEAPIDIHIISHQEGTVIEEPSSTFQWEGSNNLVNEFSYRLVKLSEPQEPLQQEWSQWSSDVSTSFERLHEGNYLFEIKGRYEPGNESDAPLQRHFSIDIPFDLILMVQSDKSIYSLGETAGFTVTLRNISPGDIWICFLNTPGYRISARNEQTGYMTLTSPPSGIPSPDPVRFTLGPGEEDTYSDSWNLKELGLGGGSLVPPGDYRVTAEIVTCEEILVPHIESYPISITIVDR